MVKSGVDGIVLCFFYNIRYFIRQITRSLKGQPKSRSETFTYPEAEIKPAAKDCCLFTTTAAHKQGNEAVS